MAAGIQASLERLWRLDDVMREMLRLDPAVAGLPPASPSRTQTRCHLSQRMLDELSHAQGEVPLHARPRRERGLALVGGKRRGNAKPIYLRIDWHLRLRLDGESQRVRIDRLQGTRWLSTGLYAIKDGSGGIRLDLMELERRIGPFSIELRRALERHGQTAARGHT